jgi:hypothetical protein
MDKEPALHHSRRALLGAALGGAAVVAAQSVRPLDVRAVTGDPVLVGKGAGPGENTADAPTVVTNSTSSGTALGGTSAEGGIGVLGSSLTNVGVFGRSLSTTPSDFISSSSRAGVRGTAGDDSGMATNQDETGVYGFASVSEGSTGVWGHSPTGTGVFGSGFTGTWGEGFWGVYGFGDAGVVGDAAADGVGVYGFTGDTFIPEPTVSGVGVYAKAATTSQVALYVDGKARFSRSKRVSIGASKTSLKVTMTGVSTSSYILATLQTSVSGCYVRAVVPASGYFTIYLSKAPGKTAYIGYLVIN